MKQSPELQRAQERMRPGVLTRDGLLGTDNRALAQILEEDDNSVRNLGRTHRQIADRMECLTRAGRRGLGTAVCVDDEFEVTVQEWRGGIPCPWDHSGMYRKSVTELVNTRLGERLRWTALSIHLVREHGFYGGRGSEYRIEPARAVRVLDL